MGLMNQSEYAQACLFRVREGLQTASSWWEQDPRLTPRKIEQTRDMLQDLIDELQYFEEKMETPTRDEDDYQRGVPEQPDIEGAQGGYDPIFTDNIDAISHGHSGLYKE